MKFNPTAIPDVIIIEPEIFRDQRGFFMETWHKKKFAKAGINTNFIQDNYSKSNQGILRGLHYQVKQAQGKLIRVIEGEIFDVAVDMRKSSPTFGTWVSEILSSNNRKILWAPPGFAHGFYVISESAEITYKCTDYYAPQFERTLKWDDKDLNIDWPLLAGTIPVLSEKDANGNLFVDSEYYS